MSGRFVSIDDMIQCARREVGMRERVYPNWVAAKRMSQEKADREIEVMRAIVDKLEQIAGRRA